MDRIYVDIETIPARTEQEVAYLQNKLEAPGNYKHEEAIEKWKTEHWPGILEKTALHPLWGEIIAVGWAWNDGDITSIVRPKAQVLSHATPLRAARAHRFEAGEGAFLRAVWEGIRDARPGPGNRTCTWCGFNVGFDLRFLRLRSLKLGVKPTVYLPVNEPAWSQAIVDAQGLIGGRDLKYVSLEEAALALLGIPPFKPQEISRLWDAWEIDNLAGIREHVERDVEVTRQLCTLLDPPSKLDYTKGTAP